MEIFKIGVMYNLDQLVLTYKILIKHMKQKDILWKLLNLKIFL